MKIDPHVHFRDGEQAYKETIAHGLALAKKQGVDIVFDMPNTAKPITTGKDVDERLKLVPKSEKDRYFLYVGATSDPSQLKEAVELVNTRKEVIGIKMFAGKSTGDLAILTEEKQQKFYQTLVSLEYTGVVATHCEKEELMTEEFDSNRPISHAECRPNKAEIESIKDQIRFAKEAKFKGTLHICHVSCIESIKVITDAKKNGQRITCGATPHHLLWTEDKIRGDHGLLYKMNPPLRSTADLIGLREALRNGHIDWIETDHAPHTIGEKLLDGFPSGYPSLHLYKMLIDKLPDFGLSAQQISDVTYNNIVKTFKLNLDETSKSSNQTTELNVELKNEEHVNVEEIVVKKTMIDEKLQRQIMEKYPKKYYGEDQTTYQIKEIKQKNEKIQNDIQTIKQKISTLKVNKMEELTQNQKKARSKICLPLDGLNTIEEVKARVELLSPVVGLFKIGKESFTRFGPEVVKLVQSYSSDVFLDLKYHDIPNTVKGACKAAAELGVKIINVHASGGLTMMKAGKEGIKIAKIPEGFSVPKLIAVTVLTSIDKDVMNNEIGIDGEVSDEVLKLARLTSDAGLDGIVCSAADLERIHNRLPENFMYITPGIKGPNTAAGSDQKRVFTPGNAIRDGSTILVIGRAITGASDPVHAGLEVIDDMVKAMEE